MVGAIVWEMEGGAVQAEARLKKKLPPESYKVVEEEFVAIEAYMPTYRRRRLRRCQYSFYL